MCTFSMLDLQGLFEGQRLSSLAGENWCCNVHCAPNLDFAHELAADTAKFVHEPVFRSVSLPPLTVCCQSLV